MRELLRDFADRGDTVLLSSHLLREVEAIADRLVVIARGQIVAQGTPEDLLADIPRTAVRTAGGDAADRRLREALRDASIPARDGADGLTLRNTTETTTASAPRAAA